jgi:hypothetical protein
MDFSGLGMEISVELVVKAGTVADKFLGKSLVLIRTGNLPALG